MAGGVKDYDITRDEAKSLLLRVGFLGSFNKWLRDRGLQRKGRAFDKVLDSVSKAVREFGKKLLAGNPALAAYVASLKRPEATAVSLHYMNVEREWLETIEAALPAGSTAQSYEHDGIDVLTGLPPAELLANVQGRVPMQLAVKAPPDVMEHLQKVAPDYQWSPSKLTFGTLELIDMWRICRESLCQGSLACRVRAGAFGKVMAANMEGRVLVPRHAAKTVEEFVDATRTWSSTPRDREDLFLMCRKRMGIFRAVKCEYRNFKYRPGPKRDLQDPLLDPAFSNGVCIEALLFLKTQVRPLDSPDFVRHQIMFSCGTLYNFATGTSRRGEPSDRVGRHCNASFEKPDLPSALMAELEGPDGLAANLLQFFKDGGTSIMDALAGADAGLRLQRASRIRYLLEQASNHDALFKFLQTWTMDLDEMIMIARFLSRGFSAHPRFTEALWIVGAAEGGKDLFLSILQACMGEGVGGTTQILPYGYLTSQGTGRTEGCSPFLRACSGARFVIVSEVPAMPITLATLKPLCEQRGAQVASRDLYETSNGFRPMCLPIITSNFAPELQHREQSDTGGSSRVRVFVTPHIYTLTPTLPSHRLADPTLGDKALRGELSASLVWLLMAVYPTLDLSTASRNIAPIPDRISEDTLAAMQGPPPAVDAVADPFVTWRSTLRGVSVAEASSTADVFASAQNAMRDHRPSQLRSRMTSAGFIQGRVAMKRYWLAPFPGHPNGLPIALP